MTPKPVVSERSQREAAFHDHRFSHDEGVRRSSRFYALAAPSKQFLADQISMIDPPAQALELGCGPDGAAWGLAARGVGVTGIDISDEAISLARTRAASEGIDPQSFLQMNAEALDFDDSSFDVVIGSSILHHLDLDRSISEIRRVLRPGGRALFYEPSGHNPIINLYRRLTPNERSIDERPLTDSDLAALGAGFDRVDVSYFHLTSLASLPLRRTRLFDRASNALETVDRALLDRLPSTRRYAWVMVIDAQVAVETVRPTGNGQLNA